MARLHLLQLSDPHLLADPQALHRDRNPLLWFEAALAQVERLRPDVLLLSGDLCHDESWGGYVRLREQLEGLRRRLSAGLQVALVPGNHDQPQLLRAALGRQVCGAPALLELGRWRLLLLDSHRSGCIGGWLGAWQLAWLQAELTRQPNRPTLVVVHHPPLPIGDAGMDAIRLHDGAALLACLTPLPGLRALLFGHVHQHWQAPLPGRDPALPAAWLLGCPSTLRSFPAVQPCPLGRSEDPGGRWLALADDGGLQQRLLRWAGPALPSLAAVSGESTP